MTFKEFCARVKLRKAKTKMTRLRELLKAANSEGGQAVLEGTNAQVDPNRLREARLEELGKVASEAGVVRASEAHAATNRAIERITEEHEVVEQPTLVKH